MTRPHPALTVMAATASLVALMGLSLAAGPVSVPLEAWLDPGDPRSAILLELRLPRTLLAVVVGAGLGLSGAALQGYTRNPLADPGVLGVSSTAALGAVVALYFGLTALSPWAVPLMAIAGALAGVGLLVVLSGRQSSVVTFILAGAVLNLIAGAGVSLALSLAPNPWAVAEILDWLMGALTDRSRQDLWLASPFVAAGCALLLTAGRGLDALTLGETGARSLGIPLGRLRWTLAVGVALATGAGVAVTGVIGFVGLVVPHLLRPFVGQQPSRLLVPSAVVGAAVLLAADIVVRTFPAPSGEIKLGIALSAVGAPFFLALLLRLRGKLA